MTVKIWRHEAPANVTIFLTCSRCEEHVHIQEWCEHGGSWAEAVTEVELRHAEYAKAVAAHGGEGTAQRAIIAAVHRRADRRLGERLTRLARRLLPAA